MSDDDLVWVRPSHGDGDERRYHTAEACHHVGPRHVKKPRAVLDDGMRERPSLATLLAREDDQ